MGYNKFTKFEKPILETKTALTHIKMAYCLYVFLLYAIFSKKLVPKEILVVRIELKIINPYIYLHIGEIFFIFYTVGISKFLISTSILVKIKKTISDNTITKVAVNIDTIYCPFLLLTSFLKVISTGINNIVL